MDRIKVGDTLNRSFAIKHEAVNEEARTVELAFSSELPYRRMFGDEILSHDNDAVDLSRMNTGANLLLDHDSSKVIGVVENVRIDEDRIGRANVRFSRSALGQETFNDVMDGIRTSVSVGYQVTEMVLEKAAVGKDDVYRVTKWMPLEVSLVGVPADATVGVGRSLVQQEIKQMEKKMEKEIIVEDLAVIERTRVTEITGIGKMFKMEKEADDYITLKQSADSFRSFVLARRYDAKPIETMPSQEIGMTVKEIKRWSLVRAIDQSANGALTGFEKECSDAQAQKIGRSPVGFFIPEDIFGSSKRALTAGVNTEGKFTIEDTLRADQFITLLRNRMVTANLGATVLSGLTGNVLIPKKTAAGNAQWLAELAPIVDSQLVFGQIALSPKRLGSTTPFSRTLLKQSSLDVETLVREDLLENLALAYDLAALHGTGAAGQPLGIALQPGISTVTFAGAPSWAKVVAFETALGVNNAPLSARGYVTTAGVKGVWKTTTKAVNYPVYLWDDTAGAGGPTGMVNGYRAEATQQVVGDVVFFGAWDSLITATWAGIDIITDPYTLAKSNQIQVTVQMLADINIRRASSFVVSTDAGNQ
jgi:HK97 family phage major capsid protein